MKKAILVAFSCCVIVVAITLVAYNDQNSTYQETQTLQMRLDYICPVAFKETSSWHLAGSETFWLKTTPDGGETEFRFLEVQNSDLIRNIPRDSLIGRQVKLTVQFVGDLSMRNPFAQCKLLGFEFLE